MSQYKHARLASLVILLLILTISACMRESAAGDQAADLIVTMTLDPQPPQVGEGIILLSVQDERGLPIRGLDIKVKGDMTHAGMTPVFGVSEELENGNYRIPFEWSMAGDWILQIAADLPDDRILNRSFEVRVAPQ